MKWARVLRKTYGRSRAEVLEALEGLLASRDVVMGDREAIQAAVRRCREGAGDFADYFIHESANRAGCESVATFDEGLHEEEGFIPV